MATPLKSFGNSSSDYMKSFVVGEGKVGKTTYLAASCLGALPGQTRGLVDKPENLHVFGFDEGFVDGLHDFITKFCGKPESYLDVSVHDMTEARRAAGRGSDWDYGLYTAVIKEAKVISDAAKRGGVHAVIVSSLTGLAEGFEMGLQGPPNAEKRGGGMDMSKWQDLGRQITHVRNVLQQDAIHVFWEGHVTKAEKMEGGQKVVEEKIVMHGDKGRNFGFNVEHVFRLRREMTKYPGTQIDKVYVDTKPSLGFVSGGRGVAALSDREYDLVDVATKLGKKVGGWK